MLSQIQFVRKEPVLVVGGGLITDVAGFACAAYRVVAITAFLLP